MGKRKLDFSSPSQSKLTNLSAFGFSNSSNVVSETSSSPKPSSSNKGASTNVTPDAKTPCTCIRKFQDSWKIGRPWLRCDSKLKFMFCDICVNSQIVNSFTTGCDIMRKECVTKHESRKGKLLHIIYNVVSIPCFHSPFQNNNVAQHSS